jgi:diacylglycerol kinase (ATP)
MADAATGRFLIIANPVSGGGRGRKLAERLLPALQKRGMTARIAYTAGPGDAGRIAAQAISQDPEIIPLACGGDGTIHEIAASAVAANRPMAAVAAGRCNDLLRALDFPFDIDKAAARLASAQPRPIDICRLNDKYFCTIAALGFDAAVSRFVNDARLHFHGKPAYLWGVARMLISYKPVDIRLEGDFGVREGPVFLTAIANTKFYGGGIPMAPMARADDGLMDICVVWPLSRLRVLRLLPKALKGTHIGMPEVTFYKTKSLKITSAVPIEIWADGECAGKTPVNIEVVPGALRMMA